MGVIVDTSVFINLERASEKVRDADLGQLLSAILTPSLDADEEVAISAITASELLHGVHRAASALRARRDAYVESVLGAIPVIEFDLYTARVHARLWADLSASGRDIGAHDRLVAATAIGLGWKVATGNLRHFDRVPGLEVVAVA
jgi:tRNA(fMet)-specific endonuclease VapC